MKIGDLVQYVDPATRKIPNTPMPLVLLGVVLDMKVLISMASNNTAVVHAQVQWNNKSQQCHWFPVDYLEVIG